MDKHETVLKVFNSNNINEGQINISPDTLNLKYAINGTGKSTIAKTIRAFVEKDEEKKKALIQYRYYDSDKKEYPRLEGYENIKSVAVFDEKYVDHYVFREDELIQNSFQIFVKTPKYDQQLKEIEDLLEDVNRTFKEHPELDTLLQDFNEFIQGFGKAKSGISGASQLVKALGRGNKIKNIPQGLEPYKPYLQDKENVKWLKWQLEGSKYLPIANQCPYCSGSIEQTKETIEKVKAEFEPKSIEHLNKILEVFQALEAYFSDDTVRKLHDIYEDVMGITDANKHYLVEIKTEVERVNEQLKKLKYMSFSSLKNIERIKDELNNYRIDLTDYPHLNSNVSSRKVDIINSALDDVLGKARDLQAAIGKQKTEIRRTISQHKKEINEFMYYAGYNYEVDIEENDGGEYHLLLKPKNSDIRINAVDERLSYGEKNALALVLFMYNAIYENSDLIILDDPISSFDGNKKFAILNKLFLERGALKNKTVLMLTHEFNTVIDVIHNVSKKFETTPTATFLTTNEGILSEKEITKDDIKSFEYIAFEAMKSDIDVLNKAIYLRRLLEIRVEPNESKLENEMAWNLLSNLFHKREIPEYKKDNTAEGFRPMTKEEIDLAEEVIHRYIPDFEYSKEYERTKNDEELKELYRNSKSNYEKLQIYRIIHTENNSNTVIKKFVNEVFHVENDCLFQLNPMEYDTIPQYVIDECDKDIDQ